MTNAEIDTIEYRDETITLDRAGLIPFFLAEWPEDKSWQEWCNIAYAHGGGWYTGGNNWGHEQGCLTKDLLWRNPSPEPGEPDIETSRWLITFKTRGHVIRLHESAWVSVEYPDGTFEVSRMD